jgi:hypothetical protein
MNCIGAWIGNAIARGNSKGMICIDFCRYYLLVATVRFEVYKREVAFGVGEREGMSGRGRVRIMI